MANAIEQVTWGQTVAAVLLQARWFPGSIDANIAAPTLDSLG
jgi:hypothetical protein